MSERLRPRDLAFLAEESPTTPMHNATVEIFEPGDSGFDYQRLVELIEDRISFVPRYRQRVQFVPGRLANPVWVDDQHFDLGFHVRRSALPRPGSLDQLRELVARIVSRPLDRTARCGRSTSSRGSPTAGSRCSRSRTRCWSTASTPSTSARCCSTSTPEPRTLGHDEWRPPRDPSPAGLMPDAVRDSLEQPGLVLDTVRSNTGVAAAHRRDRRQPGRLGRERADQPARRRASRRSTGRSPSSAGS